MTFDVLGVGCVAIDDVLYVDAFPEADRKIRVLRRERRFGGLTGGALVAAARLGARCAYAGRLGSDEFSRLVEENLTREKIDTTHLPRVADAQPVYSTIIVAATGTRNVFSCVSGVTGAHDSLPHAEVIRDSRVLFVDHHGVPGSVRAARIAREAGRAVVADLERDDSPQFAELLALVDHLIVPARFACRISGAPDPEEAAIRLWREDRAAIVVTAGASGCWYLSPELQAPTHFPAHPVNVVDTTGCGDVFHGAYAAALANGTELPERIRFATAAAALNASRSTNRHGALMTEEVSRLLNSLKLTAASAKQ